MLTRIAAVCWLILGLATPLAAQAPAPAATAAPFAAEIQAFAQWDTKNATPAGGVLFVGSSTIRLWPTATAFPGLPVINRGFGGSQIVDVNRYVAETVLKYAPDIVVFYAGDNDVNEGKSAEQVRDDYRTFVQRVLVARPSTQIVFLAIKPSVARWKVWPVMKDANARIKAYSDGFNTSAREAGRPAALHFVDVATPMLGPGESMPAASFFVADGLHMTPAGYALWNGILSPVLTRLRGEAK
jgi:lysophospholipase L1-like esterase